MLKQHVVLFLMGCINYPHLLIFIKYIHYTSDLEAIKGIKLSLSRRGKMACGLYHQGHGFGCLFCPMHPESDLFEVIVSQRLVL